MKAKMIPHVFSEVHEECAVLPVLNCKLYCYTPGGKKYN